MIRIIVLTLTWFGFCIIASEMFNSFEILDERVNVLILSVPATVVFFVSQVVMVHYEKKAGLSPEDENRYKLFLKRYYFVLGLIGFITFVLVPFVWWGVIEQLANIAEEGYRKF